MNWKIRKSMHPYAYHAICASMFLLYKLDLMDAADVALSSNKGSPSAYCLVVCELVPFPRLLSTHMSFRWSVFNDLSHDWLGRNNERHSFDKML